MSAVPLPCQFHAKPWGSELASVPWLTALLESDWPADQKVGEVWFGTGDGGQELLIKLLTTTEPLSIQVHPDDAYARQQGWPCGKHEAWVVLDAQPGPCIGLGLRQPMSAQQLRDAARDGRLPQLLHWQPVRPGDVIDVPPGTIHAIGAGLSLLEIQQPADLTFRLFDFARGRELHLDEGCAVSHLQPYRRAITRLDDSRERVVLCDAGPFTLEAWQWVGPRTFEGRGSDPLCLVPVKGTCVIDGQAARVRTAWHLHGPCRLEMAPGTVCVVAYAHSERPSPPVRPPAERFALQA